MKLKENGSLILLSIFIIFFSGLLIFRGVIPIVAILIKTYSFDYTLSYDTVTRTLHTTYIDNLATQQQVTFITNLLGRCLLIFIFSVVLLAVGEIPCEHSSTKATKIYKALSCTFIVTFCATFSLWMICRPKIEWNNTLGLVTQETHYSIEENSAKLITYYPIDIKDLKIIKEKLNLSEMPIPLKFKCQSGDTVHTYTYSDTWLKTARYKR